MAPRSFASLILLDPFLLPGKQVNIPVIRQTLVARAQKRKSTWYSRKDAYQSFQHKWEARVVDLYVVRIKISYILMQVDLCLQNFGIRENCHWLQDSSNYLTLACTREQEIVSNLDISIVCG